MNSEALKKVRGSPNLRPNYSLARRAFMIGLLLLIVNDFFYVAFGEEFYSTGASPFFSYTSLALLFFASVSTALSAFSFLSKSREILPETDKASNQVMWSLRKIVGDTFYGEKKVVISAAVIYAVIFAFLDAILIFQPGINFGTAYGVSNPSMLVTVCCGPTGYVPVLLVFIPALSFGLELVPFSAMMMALISTLVGLNLALLYRAVKQSRPLGANSRRSGKGTFGGVVGAAFGLFAGCPSCAATFFLSMIAGSGATAFSILVSEYQPLIVILTVPLLLASIFWQSKSIRRLLSCST